MCNVAVDGLVLVAVVDVADAVLGLLSGPSFPCSPMCYKNKHLLLDRQPRETKQANR
jgi:hypothetical protein